MTISPNELFYCEDCGHVEPLRRDGSCGFCQSAAVMPDALLPTSPEIGLVGVLRS